MTTLPTCPNCGDAVAEGCGSVEHIHGVEGFCEPCLEAEAEFNHRHGGHDEADCPWCPTCLRGPGCDACGVHVAVRWEDGGRTPVCDQCGALL